MPCGFVKTFNSFVICCIKKYTETNERNIVAKSLSSIAPVERSKTLGRQVLGELRAAIMAGRFSPGEKLTIRAVASALDVSMTPAREALYNLAAEGVLDMRENGSVYIHELKEERILELLKIRLALEGLAAREAAKWVTAKQISQAEDLNNQLNKADHSHNFKKLINLNWQFHFYIYSISDMPQLLRMIEGCWLMAGSYLNVIYPEFGKVDEGLKNHERIIKALKSKKPDRLEAAVCNDIEYAMSSLVSVINSNTFK